VVTTSVAGIGELVEHERTGLVVPERDPDAVADALERLLADRELAAALAERGRRRVEERFSLERNVSTLRRLFAEVEA
jgi:glycosyltransferase involved in cell wall biosynthesis